MPRLNRRSKRRSNGDEEGLVDHLLTGFCIGCILHDAEHDGDELRPRWEKLRDVLLPQFVRENPGERPWAWWRFDAPGRRERTDGGIHPFDNKERILYVAKCSNERFLHVAYRLHFGYPSAFIGPWDDGLNASWFEETWEYLVRHNLLLPEDSPFDQEAAK